MLLALDAPSKLYESGLVKVVNSVSKGGMVKTLLDLSI